MLQYCHQQYLMSIQKINKSCCNLGRGIHWKMYWLVSLCFERAHAKIFFIISLWQNIRFGELLPLKKVKWMWWTITAFLSWSTQAQNILNFIQRGLELKAELNLSPIRLNVTQLKNRPCSKSIKAQLGKHHIEPYTIEKWLVRLKSSLFISTLLCPYFINIPGCEEWMDVATPPTVHELVLSLRSSKLVFVRLFGLFCFVNTHLSRK